MIHKKQFSQYLTNLLVKSGLFCADLGTVRYIAAPPPYPMHLAMGMHDVCWLDLVKVVAHSPHLYSGLSCLVVVTACRLKVHGPIFQNLVFYSFEESSLERCKFQISVETVKLFGCTKDRKQFCILQLPIAIYLTVCRPTVSEPDTFSLISSKRNPFQLYHGLWENYDELSCDSKISKSLEKIEKIGLGCFKVGG